jgi:alcohol dehydrogenase (cytochrome c)
MDAATGKRLWSFNVIPRPGEVGSNSWNDLPYPNRSGGAIWTTAYYDPGLNLVFVGTGNSYDNASLARPAKGHGVTNDGLFTDSTLAINPDTGTLVWYFQHMAGDLWDLDWAFEQQIIPLSVNGKLTQSVVTMGKPGILDAVDAATGRYLFSIDAGLQNVVERIDPKTGAKIKDKNLTPGATTKFVCPQVTGAKNWAPSSYNPDTGMLYAAMIESCMTMSPADPGDFSPFSAGVLYSIAPRPGSDGKYGRVQAFDLKQRKTTWSARQRAPLTSGMLATAGGVVFAGALDRGFAAYDDATGEVLWRTRLGNVPSAPPITFAAGGKQYIAVVTGFGTPFSTGYMSLVPEIQPPGTPSSSIYVFALP